MKLQPLLRLLAFGAMLGCVGQALAQGTMEVRQGSRHAGPGAVGQSASTFAVGVTRDNGVSYVNTASVSESVQIRGEIRPEPANVGQTADIFVVDRLVDSNDGHISFSMRTAAGVWAPWNGTVSLLVPFQEDVPLNAVHQLTMFEGTLGTAGSHRIFLGYMASDGILRYHTSGLSITITDTPAQSPLDEAKAYFSSTINPGVVPFCLDCHVSGGSAQGLAQHVFVRGSTSAAIDTNFSQLRSLFSARGKVYIMAKVRGENAHVGGSVLPASSPQYRDLELFLDLLARI